MAEPRGGREPQCLVPAEGEEGVAELWLTRGRRRRREEAGAVVLLLAAAATAPMLEDVAVVFLEVAAKDTALTAETR